MDPSAIAGICFGALRAGQWGS
uniref:Uncharacterized protein n=1 Tax=Arundo donax TaxID=35708 RepID=A0A0A9C3P1_ARUDO